MDVTWKHIVPRRPEGHAVTTGRLDTVLAASGALGDFLSSAASGSADPLLVINDPYRATQTRPVLTALAELLRTLKLRLRFSVLVATGTHVLDPRRRREFEESTLSCCGLSLATVTWHDSDNVKEMAAVSGVHLNDRIVRSRHVLGIGSLEPHYFAGVTGPHKTLTIGCMARVDIEANHSHALSPYSQVLRTRGNPVFDSIAAVLAALASNERKLCAISEVVCNDAIVAAAAGDPLDILDDLMPPMRQCFVYPVEQPADILHLRVPPPLGRNLYQADKALKNHASAVRDGGGIVLEAACEEGIGPRRFVDLLRAAPTYSDSCNLIARQGYCLGDHKAVRLRHLTDPACRGVQVVVASGGLKDADLEGTGLPVFSDVSQAIHWLGQSITPGGQLGLFVEDAGNLCPALLDEKR